MKYPVRGAYRASWRCSRRSLGVDDVVVVSRRTRASDAVVDDARAERVAGTNDEDTVAKGEHDAAACVATRAARWVRRIVRRRVGRRA